MIGAMHLVCAFFKAAPVNDIRLALQKRLEQSRHIAGVVRQANERQAQRVEPTADPDKASIAPV